MLSRILKANQVKTIETPFFVGSSQNSFDDLSSLVKEQKPSPQAKAAANNEDAFIALSPEELASGGQIKTKKTDEPAPQNETPDESTSEVSESDYETTLDSISETAQSQDLEENSEVFSKEDFEITSQPPKPSSKNKDESYLSQAALKARNDAILEQLKTKELELQALENELREWEAKLQQQEQDLVKKDQELTQANIQKRQDVEAECQQTIKMAKDAAESLKEAARTEAETIKKQAKIEVDSIKEQAYKEGFETGEEKGIAQGEEEGLKEIEIDWKNLMQESEMIVKELQASRIGMLKASEEEMLRLVISFAKSVIKIEPTINPEIVLKNIDQAINSIADVDKVVLKINLRDKAMCEAHKEKLLSKLRTVSELDIVEDPSLTAGGVKIETGVGTIDATLETQARALERALLDNFERSR